MNRPSHEKIFCRMPQLYSASVAIVFYNYQIAEINFIRHYRRIIGSLDGGLDLETMCKLLPKAAFGNN